MKEILITFQVAKLAKEKGFSEYGYYFYTEEDGLCSIDSDGDILNIYDENLNQIDYRYDSNGDFWFNDEGDVFYTPEKYLAPTQSLLAKWLREEHNIHIKIDDFIDDKTGIEWDYEIVIIGTDLDEKGNYIPLISYDMNNSIERKFKTYEEALELGLLEALNLI